MSCILFNLFNRGARLFSLIPEDSLVFVLWSSVLLCILCMHISYYVFYVYACISCSLCIVYEFPELLFEIKLQKHLAFQLITWIMARQKAALYILFFACVAQISQTANHKIAKRWLFDLGSMVKCATGRNAFDYNGYGCFCGVGGNGVPIDGIDRCCKNHDLCYEKAMKSCGGVAGAYLVPYKWNCPQNRPYCSRMQV